MSLEIIKKDIAAQNMPPVYLWYGDDRFSLTEALKAVKQVFLAEDPSGSGIEIFNGKEISPGHIVEAANTSSFFSRRLVVVDDIPYFNQAKGKGVSDEAGGETGDSGTGPENTDVLLEYCRNPNPAACLLLISQKINRTRKLYKEIAKAGKVVEFVYPQGQADWLAWLQRECRRRDKVISQATALYLLEWAGHHTGILSQELDKLCIYIRDRKDITEADIAAICVPVIETTVFSMLDAIAGGNLKAALTKLEEVLNQEHYLKVHTMIVRQIRLLLAGSLCKKRGYTLESFMQTAGIRSPYEGTKLFRQADAFQPAKLAQAMEDCLQTEIALKSSGGSPQLLLETMIIRLCKK